MALAPEDAGELLTLQRAAFSPRPSGTARSDLPPLTETVPEILAALEREIVLVGRVRGPLVASVRGMSRPGGRWYVARLAVAPDWQGQGVGPDDGPDRGPGSTPEHPAAISLLTGVGGMRNQTFYRRRHGHRRVRWRRLERHAVAMTARRYLEERDASRFRNPHACPR